VVSGPLEVNLLNLLFDKLEKMKQSSSNLQTFLCDVKVHMKD